MDGRREVINQLKWLYAALAGVCVVFFFTLLGNSESVENSIFLRLSSYCFAAALPVFTAFTLAHIVLIESNISPEKYLPALRSRRVTIITRITILVFSLAFIFLVAHFSIYFLLVTLVASAYALFELKVFFNKVRE